MSKGECQLDGYHPLKFKTRSEDLSVFIPHVFEAVFIEINIKNKHIIIGTVYQPNTPPKADVDIFSNTMQELQGIIHRENKDVFIMGDMNIDLLQYSNHYKTNDYTEEIFSQGYLPLTTKPTRLTSHSATLIDHIYTNSRSSEITSGIIVTDISDHFGIFSTIQLTTHNAQKKKNYTTSRSYNKDASTSHNMS